MVVVKQSSQPTPVDDGLDQLTLAAFAALGQALDAGAAIRGSAVDPHPVAQLLLNGSQGRAAKTSQT